MFTAYLALTKQIAMIIWPISLVKTSEKSNLIYSNLEKKRSCGSSCFSEKVTLPGHVVKSLSRAFKDLTKESDMIIGV